MRSVNVERKSRGKTRAQAPRPAGRGRELPSVQPGGGRRGKQPGFYTMTDVLGLTDF